MGLIEEINKYIGRGMVMARKKGSGEMYAWHRDIGNCWGVLVSEAITQATAYFDGDREALEALDTVSKMYILMYKKAMVDRVDGLSHFSEIYEELGKSKSAQEAYSVFCCYLAQSFMNWFFVSKEMAIGLPDSLDEDVYEHGAALNILSVLTPGLRKKVLQQLRDKGIVSSNIDLSRLLRDEKPFLDTVKRLQQEEMKANAKK